VALSCCGTAVKSTTMSVTSDAVSTRSPTTSVALVFSALRKVLRDPRGATAVTQAALTSPRSLAMFAVSVPSCDGTMTKRNLRRDVINDANVRGPDWVSPGVSPGLGRGSIA